MSKETDDKDVQQVRVLSVLEQVFKTTSSISSLEVALKLELSHEKTVGTLKSLENRNKIQLSEPKDHVVWVVTEEGHLYSQNGSPEARLFELVKNSGKSVHLTELQAEYPSDLSEIGLKNALKLKWLTMDKTTKRLTCALDTIEDSCRTLLSLIESNVNQIEEELVNKMEEKDPLKKLNELKKRKLLDVKKTKFYDIDKGSQFSTEIKKLATDLTQDMIINDTWKDLEFKPYNFFAAGVKPQRGCIHPLMKVLKKFKKILMSMQFEEMPTRSWVESSFWNFDSLFQPQQHPARDVQDTFFLKSPSSANSNLLPQDYVKRVKEMHEKGGMGSIGWRYEWSIEETEKNILRTHTTANSARMLYELAQEYQKTGIFRPKRYFSIDRVFRNETLDATHLAEFHQVEGLICDKGMTLGDLMGVLRTFYKKIGISDLKFKPAYNPYTEPSMEIFGFHPLLNKWIEVGNSGIFRPEMLLPMGFPEDVAVIAWGLSLERPTMISYGIRNIRELFGHKALLEFV